METIDFGSAKSECKSSRTLIFGSFDVIGHVYEWTSHAKRVTVLAAQTLTLVAAIVVTASDAFSLTFEPTELEWNVWTPECRARYTISQAGRNSRFAERVPRTVVQQFESRFGIGWESMHHYCAGIILLRQASASGDSTRANFLRSRTIKESEYTRQRTPASERLYADVLLLQSRAFEDWGKRDEAQELVNQAIQLHPSYAAPYAFGSILLKRTGKPLDARNLLLEALSNNAEPAAELHYFLGLIFLELDDFESASLHADKATELGYPLLGIHRAIARRRNDGENK